MMPSSTAPSARFWSTSADLATTPERFSYVRLNGRSTCAQCCAPYSPRARGARSGRAAATRCCSRSSCPRLPTLQHDLDTTPTGVTWVFTAYLLSASVATPIAGRLGDMFGKKRTLLVVLAGLAGGTLIAALATTLPVLIVARTIQGLGGAIFPLAFGIIRDEFPRERVAGRDRAHLGSARDRRRPRDRARRADPRQPRLPLALLDPVRGHRRDGGRHAVRHPGVADPGPRLGRLARRRAALALARLPAARDQRGAAVGLGIGTNDRAARRRGRGRSRVGRRRGPDDERRSSTCR